jgi:DNA polymerase-1
MQMLQGDTADNIPGLPRLDDKPVGPKRAEKLLAGTACDDDAFDIVAHAYAFEYGDEWRKRITEQALLLWLRTDRDASLYNWLQVVPGADRPPLLKQAGIVEQRIKEAYEQAQSLGGCAVPRDDAA